MSKSSFLQIRVSEEQKALLKAAAARADKDLSSWVLERILPAASEAFARLVSRVPRDGASGFAALIDFLQSMTASDRASIEAEPPGLVDLSPYHRNYIAALVEQRCEQLGVDAPQWTREIEPLGQPLFGTSLESIRPYLLVRAPVAFRRRNIFVDAGVGDRV